MNRLGLRPADTGGNVLIGQPFDPVVFDRTEQDGRHNLRSGDAGYGGPDDGTRPRPCGSRGPGRMDGSQRGSMATPVDANYVRAQVRPPGRSGGAGSPSGERPRWWVHRRSMNTPATMPGITRSAPFTFDADLALIPELLADDPRVIDAMQQRWLHR